METCVRSMHSVETCGQTNILAQHLFKTMLQIVLLKKCKFVVYINKYLVIIHNKNCRSRTISRNWSALTNMINIQRWVKMGLLIPWVLEKQIFIRLMSLIKRIPNFFKVIEWKIIFKKLWNNWIKLYILWLSLEKRRREIFLISQNLWK